MSITGQHLSIKAFFWSLLTVLAFLKGSPGGHEAPLVVIITRFPR